MIGKSLLDRHSFQDSHSKISFNISNHFRLAKTEIKQLENEVGRWQVLVEAVTGISPPDFDAQTLAVLRGRLVRYLMRSREVPFILFFSLFTLE